MRRKIVALLIAACLCVVAAELACRSFWFYFHGVPFLSPERILYAFYPELLRVDSDPPAAHDNFDILLLSGSVLHPNWGYVDQILRQKFLSNGYEKVRIYNLAVPAHTSRDSLLKYAALDPARFDLVVFYHGINGVRANNVPSELYRDNYDHYFWYEIVNALAPYHKTARMAFPYSLHYLRLRIKQILKHDNYIPTETPRQEWIQYGEYARSVSSLRQNVTRLLDLALRRGDRVLLLTVAVHVPQNYSLERFAEKSLDFNLHLTPIEMWGDPDDVENTVALHNDVIRSIVKDRGEVLFMDMASRMPKGRRYFNDVCHLTHEGSEIVADHLFDLIVALLKKAGHQR